MKRIMLLALASALTLGAKAQQIPQLNMPESPGVSGYSNGYPQTIIIRPYDNRTEGQRALDAFYAARAAREAQIAREQENRLRALEIQQRELQLNADTQAYWTQLERDAKRRLEAEKKADKPLRTSKKKVKQLSQRSG